jgi:hypothetical protein
MIVVTLLYDKFELDTLPGRISLGIPVFQISGLSWPWHSSRIWTMPQVSERAVRLLA